MAVISRSIAEESWALRAPFVIARGTKTEARVVTVTLTDGTSVGRGECVPYARYDETLSGVREQLERAPPIERRHLLVDAMPAGAARNALDCALWDLEAKRSGKPAAVLVGLAPLRSLETCFTLSLDTPDRMAAAALAVPDQRLLKLKLGGEGDAERMQAVRRARPDARLVADANESWPETLLAPLLAAAAEARLELVEQPLSAGRDQALGTLAHAVPICADESVHTRLELPALQGLYDAVNIKLDKAGGLTEALAMAAMARELGLKIMAGCMVSTSLAMAPAFLLGQTADWVDLDGPLLLLRDRAHGLVINNGVIAPPSPALWG